MLAAVEARFLPALKAALPPTTQVLAGPPAGPPGPSNAAATELVELWAARLIPALGDGEDPAAARAPATFTQLVRWPADGVTTEFRLPDDALGLVADVESPPGRPLRRGDDYDMDDRVIRFYRPPLPADSAVVALVRGAPARGFQDKRRCEITLVLRAWARAADAMDALLARALAALLVASAEPGNIEAALPDGAGVRLRLVAPVAALAAVERAREALPDAAWYRAEARLSIRGELDLSVVLGAPEPEGIIREIQGDIQASARPGAHLHVKVGS